MYLLEKPSEIGKALWDLVLEDSSDEFISFRAEEGADFYNLSALYFSLVDGKEVTLEYYEFGIWPSSENRFLISAIELHCFGLEAQHRPMVFRGNEHRAAITLLQIGLQSGWGGVCFADIDSWFKFDHDGFGLIKSPNASRIDLGRIRGVKMV